MSEFPLYSYLAEVRSQNLSTCKPFSTFISPKRQPTLIHTEELGGATHCAT
jgi:hypothetical protein